MLGSTSETREQCQRRRKNTSRLSNAYERAGDNAIFWHAAQGSAGDRFPERESIPPQESASTCSLGVLTPPLPMGRSMDQLNSHWKPFIASSNSEHLLRGARSSPRRDPTASIYGLFAVIGIAFKVVFSVHSKVYFGSTWELLKHLSRSCLDIAAIGP